ncbi:MAG TPA: Maf family protein [Rhodocyclaceae bacterium]|nr:Maf family protein [Rhodocyclaceae bacterium]
MDISTNMAADTSLPRIYLASTSPRRRELLQQIGIDFDTLFFRIPPREDDDISEDIIGNETATEYVVRVAAAKAEGAMRRIVWRKLRRQAVLSADTTLEVEGEIIGKPNDAEHAKQILRKLSGREHRVLTAVALADGDILKQRLSISTVRMREISEEEIAAYIESGEPFGKAGAYGIQGRAAAFISEIHGSYSGIMGLPLFETAELLREFSQG